MDLTSCPASPVRWERDLKSDGAIVLHYSMCRPAFPDSGKQRRMERYFARLAQLWQARWENELFLYARQAFAARQPDKPFSPWQACMEYQITYWNPPLLSIRIDIKEQGAAAPPALQCIGEVWDCTGGYPCSLYSFLPQKPFRWKKCLISLLQEQAGQRLDSGEALLYDNCLSAIKDSFDPERFYLTEDGVTVFYPLYTLGPYGEGIPTFSIPVSQSNQSNRFRAPSMTARR